MQVVAKRGFPAGLWSVGIMGVCPLLLIVFMMVAHTSQFQPAGGSPVDLPDPRDGDPEARRVWFERLTEKLLAGVDLRGAPYRWLAKCVRVSPALARRVIADPELTLYQGQGGWSLAQFGIEASEAAAVDFVKHLEQFGWPEHNRSRLWPLLGRAVRHEQAAHQILDRPDLAQWRGPFGSDNPLLYEAIDYHDSSQQRVLRDPSLRNLEARNGETAGAHAMCDRAHPRRIKKLLSLGPILQAPARVRLTREAGTSKLYERTLFGVFYEHQRGPEGFEGSTLKYVQNVIQDLSGEEFQAAFHELARLQPPAATAMLAWLSEEQWAELEGPDFVPLLTQSNADARKQALKALSSLPDAAQLSALGERRSDPPSR